MARDVTELAGMIEEGGDCNFADFMGAMLGISAVAYVEKPRHEWENDWELYENEYREFCRECGFVAETPF